MTGSHEVAGSIPTSSTNLLSLAHLTYLTFPLSLISARSALVLAFYCRERGDHGIHRSRLRENFDFRACRA